MTPPSPGGAAAAACRELSSRLPGRVGGGERRRVEPSSPYTAAWQDPAIVLRCGVDRPAALTATSELVVVNGVDWLAEQRSGGYVFTTTGRTAYVEMRVPHRFKPEVDALVDVAGAVTAAVPATR